MPHVCEEPALSWVNASSPATTEGPVWSSCVPSPSWPWSFAPQHCARPASLSAQECRPPAATVARSGGNETVAAVEAGGIAGRPPSATAADGTAGAVFVGGKVTFGTTGFGTTTGEPAVRVAGTSLLLVPATALRGCAGGGEPAVGRAGAASVSERAALPVCPGDVAAGLGDGAEGAV